MASLDIEMDSSIMSVRKGHEHIRVFADLVRKRVLQPF